MSASWRLQLHLSAKNLRNLGGLMGQSDPFAIVTVRGDDENNVPQIVGLTDVVFNCLNPSWSRAIFIDGYKFGVPLYFEVGVFDFDATTTGKSEAELARLDVHSLYLITSSAAKQRDRNFPHKVMGTALFEVGDILGSRGNMGCKSLQKGGAVYVHIERCANQGETGKVRLHLQGHKLHNVQSLGRTSSPFFELYRKIDKPNGASWIPVYRSNVVKSDLSPLWNEVTLDVEATCNGDFDRALKIIVFDKRRGGKHKQMGEFETTLRGFIEARGAGPDAEASGFTLNKHDTNTNVGTILVLDATLSDNSNIVNPSGNDRMIGQQPKQHAQPEQHRPHQQSSISRSVQPGSNRNSLPPPRAQPNEPARPEFVDYLSGGCQISLAVAIDFTASNGDPRQPGTPHYFHPPESKEWNDYEKAIFAVGSILAKYDSDQRFPVWGFGAKYNQVVRHCFQCGADVEVEGVQGIMDAYRGVFRTPLTMSYPTQFTEVIQTAAAYARHEQEVAEEEHKLSYTILLILTAGNVENVKETKQHLIEASEDPLSVVIVGIGDADFSGMEFLDEHDAFQEEGRDITKFVRFSDYKSFNALTEAVLDEIPDQLVSYFYDRNIMPGRVEGFNQDDLEVAPADDDDRTYTFLG